MNDNKVSVDDRSVLSECMQRNVPMAWYRLPFKEHIEVVVQTEGDVVHVTSYEEINRARGFLVTTFDTDPLHAYLIQADIKFEYPSYQAHDYLSRLSKLPVKDACDTDKSLASTTKETFIEQVRVIQSQILSGRLQKVVLSRVEVEPRDETQLLEDIFMDLCGMYPEAFVYFFKIPGVGCWMGATPEPFLVLEQDNGIIESVAGTMQVNGQQIDRMTWGKKEQEEQDIVTRFIDDRLQDLGISDFRKEGPVTTRAGQLVHLRTRFVFPASQIERRIGEFIRNFHPTPSVGGYPRSEALRLIAAIEKHKREFYTGIIGPLNLNGKSALFANIRCMKILKNAYCLYLGAGITAASIPEREWEETNLKKTTILAAINNNRK